MIARFHQVSLLGLLLVSCDKPQETATPPEKQVAAPRVTKSIRPARETPPVSPEQLREILAKAEAIESPIERNKALEVAIWDALELDPVLAAEGFHKLTPGSEEKNRLIQHFAMRLAEQSLDEAIKWATTLESEQEKSLAFDYIALVLAESEPQRAAHMLSDSGVPGRDFDVAVVQVVQRWAAMAPDDAASWVILFDAGEARQAGLKAVVSVWSKTDPQGSIAWLETLQDPTIRQEAVNGMAETIFDLPEESQDDLLRLATPEIRSGFEKLKIEASRK